jgi:hypothetical protein
MLFIQRWRRKFTSRIEKLNVEYCNPELNGGTIVSRLPFRLLNGLAHLLIFICKETVLVSNRPRKAKILACVGSYNNYKSFHHAFANRSDTQLATIHNFRYEGAPHIGLLFCYLTGSIFLILLPVIWLLLDRAIVRNFALVRLDQFVLGLGNRYFIRRFLNKSGAEVLLFFSNLQVHNQILIEEAHKLGIVSVFATHAPVGRGQRELTTDFALLDGEWQARIYPSSSTDVLITGSARGMRLVAQRLDRRNATGVIVATNSLTRDLAAIEQFIDLVKKRYPAIPIKLRPHPADIDRRERHREICQRKDIIFSDPKDPLVLPDEDYKYLATALSGVLTDAALIGLYPLIIRSPEIDSITSQLPHDYYGLIELGLAKYINLHDPCLPEHWQIGAELERLDLAAKRDWDAQKAMNEALDAIKDRRPEDYPNHTMVSGYQ